MSLPETENAFESLSWPARGPGESGGNVCDETVVGQLDRQSGVFAELNTDAFGIDRIQDDPPQSSDLVGRQLRRFKGRR
jgi:hypothetical protein